jgi:hypothetical protein
MQTNQDGDEMHETFGSVIYSYTRAQAIEDGVLADVSTMAREAGFKFPVAVSSGVFAVLSPEQMPQGQDFNGRLWDLLTILRMAIRRSAPGTDRVDFAPLFVKSSSMSPVPVEMYCKVGPGDEGEPVMTVMLPHED